MSSVPFLYTMDGCPHCTRAKNALDAKGIHYALALVNDREERNRYYDQWVDKLKLADPKDKRTFPKMLVSVDGEELLLPNADEIILFANSGI